MPPSLFLLLLPLLLPSRASLSSNSFLFLEWAEAQTLSSSWSEPKLKLFPLPGVSRSSNSFLFMERAEAQTLSSSWSEPKLKLILERAEAQTLPFIHSRASLSSNSIEELRGGWGGSGAKRHDHGEEANLAHTESWLQLRRAATEFIRPPPPPLPT